MNNNDGGFTQFSIPQPLDGPVMIEVPDRYYPIGFIGKGRQGIVIKAQDVPKFSPVAIKKCTEPFIIVQAAKQLYREFVLGATVRHQNVNYKLARCLFPQNSWESFTNLYLVFDLMDCDLTTLNHTRRELFTRRHGGDFIGLLVRQLLCAVKYLHQDKLRLIHRDIKPDNILLKKLEGDPFEYILKLADLGSARQLPPTTDENDGLTQYMTTRPYRAPEIILFDNYERPVDLWSVGVVLLELIYNGRIFNTSDSVKLLYSILDVIGLEDEDIEKIPIEIVKNHIREHRARFSGNRIPEILHDYWPNWHSSAITSLDFIYLLQRLLVFAPNKRMTAVEALELPMWNSALANRGYYEGEDCTVYVEDYGGANNEQWRREFLGMKYKSKRRVLEKLFRQLIEYQVLTQSQ